jgi:hypothetical protein
VVLVGARSVASGLVGLALVFVLETSVQAQTPARSSAQLTSDRPHTIAEADLGIIALPTAPISQSQRGGAVPFGQIGTGDATLLIGLKALVRVANKFEVGAGVRFGPSPTSDDQYGGAKGLTRTHSRSYYLMSAEGRYIPFKLNTFDFWGGALVGLSVIADRYVTSSGESVPTILGERSVTVRSEGLSFGLQAGVTWNLSERWITGFAMRGTGWLMPRVPSCTPIGDCATLSGAVFAIEGGFTVGYRVPL